MAGNNSDNVMVGKPVVGGAIYYATYGSEVPTDATTAADSFTDYTCVGYVSSDGFTESTETDSEEIIAWGGDTVLRPQTSYTKSYTFSLIETSTDTLKLVWGEDAVDNDGNVTHTTKQRPNVSMFVDMQLADDRILRKVMPKAQVTEVGDISYTDGDAVAYELTVTAFPVDSEVAHDYYATTDDEASKTSVKPTSAKATTTTATATTKE